MKHWFEMELEHPGSAIDHAFAEEHTHGYEHLREHVSKCDWMLLELSLIHISEPTRPY